MVNSALLTSSVELFRGFTVRASLKDMGDGYDIALTYTRKGRAVAWVKNRVENDAVNQARNELIEYIEKLGWERRIDYIRGISRWTQPEIDLTADLGD